jgi:hypothetical protein
MPHLDVFVLVSDGLTIAKAAWDGVVWYPFHSRYYAYWRPLPALPVLTAADKEALHVD